MSFENHELTDNGHRYLSQSQLGKTLRISRMAVGRGVASIIPAQLWALTNLIDPVMNIPIFNSDYIDDKTIRVVGSLSSLSVPPGGGFNLNEVGLFAEIPGELPETLYSSANTGGGGDFIPDVNFAAPVIQDIEVRIKVDRMDTVVINIQPAGLYDAVNRGPMTIGPGPYIEKIGDILHFKRYRGSGGLTIADTDNGDTITFAAPAVEPGSLCPIGAMIPYAGDETGLSIDWLICDGREILRTTSAGYPRLFAAIGTRYGEGNGTTTFNIPDTRGRMLIGAGQGTGLTNRILASLGGQEEHKLSQDELPQHGHTATASASTQVLVTGFGGQGQGINNTATGGAGRGGETGIQYLMQMWTGNNPTVWVSVFGGPTGGKDMPHNNMPPFLTGNYIIRGR